MISIEIKNYLSVIIVTFQLKLVVCLVPLTLLTYFVVADNDSQLIAGLNRVIKCVTIWGNGNFNTHFF